MEQTNEELEVVKVDDDEINGEEKLREINGVASDSETKTATDITTTKVRFVSFILNLNWTICSTFNMVSGQARWSIWGQWGFCPHLLLAKH